MFETNSHHIHFSTHRRGGRTYGHQGGYYRESSVSCSCNWESRGNGQSYAESAQDARAHLKDVGVWTTVAEQTVYAHITFKDVTEAQIIAASGRSQGIVRRSLKKLVERGNVEEYEPGLYRQTDKWFCWGL